MFPVPERKLGGLDSGNSLLAFAGHTAGQERLQPRPAPQAAALGQSAGAGRAAAPLAPTENTEICWSRLVLSHNGHFGPDAPSTRASNRFLQSLQTYSKIGMHELRFCSPQP